MATIVERYVITGVANGGNGTTFDTSGANRAYPGIRQALTSESLVYNDLPVSGTILKFNCSGTVDGQAEAYMFPNMVTDNDHYVWLYVIPESRFTGSVYDQTKYHIRNTANTAGILTGQSTSMKNILFEGVQMAQHSTNGAWTILNYSTAAHDTTLKFKDCIIRQRQVADSFDNTGGVRIGSIVRKSIQMVNVVLDNVVVISDYALSGSAPYIFYNVTSIGNSGSANSAFHFTEWSNNAQLHMKNVIAQALPGSPAYNNNLLFRTSSMNVSSFESVITNDQSSPVIALRGLTPTFLDSASYNYMLDSTDTVALNQGVDLSADALWAFDTDILGTTRPQGSAWDIGAYEMVVESLPASNGWRHVYFNWID